MVIRSADERTFDACQAILLKQIPKECVWVVNERPFEAALRKTYEFGIESHADWLMTVDADVILRKSSVAELMSEAENLPMHYFQIEGLVHDKMTGMYRKAGHRLYRTRYLKTALRQIPDDSVALRPEFTTLQRMDSKGYPSIELNSVYGIHDYKQYYRDFYRKAFIHANKHQIWIPQLIGRWKNLAAHDDDFRIALRGLHDGMMSLAKVRIDARDYIEAAQNALQDLGLREKPELPAEEIDFKMVESTLAEAGQPPIGNSSKLVETRRARFRRRYSRLGLLRLAPYLLGSALCDLGGKVKQLVDK